MANKRYFEEEDYPGQKNEIHRDQVIRDAVKAADAIIMDGSNGDTAETDYLTGMVAKVFVDKIIGRLSSEVLKNDMNNRLGKKLNSMT